MTRFLGIASVLLVVLLAMAFAAVNAGQRVTLSLGILTLYRVPVTLVAFGGLFVGMLVMFSTGIYTDLKVRKILKDRLAEESRKEQGWIDRNQQDLFAQPRDEPAASAGSGAEASREGAAVSGKAALAEDGPVSGETVASGGASGSEQGAGSEGAAAALPGPLAASEEELEASPPGSPWPQAGSPGSEAKPTSLEDESDQGRSQRSISTPGSSQSTSGGPWDPRDAGPEPEAPGRNVKDPGGLDQEGSTPEARASDSEPGPPAPEADPWTQDPGERKETTE